MLRDMTIGQFYPAESVIHRLDPRVKVVGVLAYLISLFLFRGFVGYAVVTVFLGTVIALSKVPFRYIVRGMKPILFLLIVTALFNLFGTSGDVVFHWKFITITWQGIRKAVFMSMRLSYLIVGSSMMTYTTTPNQLTDAIEKLLKPLEKIKVPVHDFAMMMSLALRFIPTLVEETEKIIAAQKSRGADFTSGNLLRRVKALIPVLVPLLLSSFRRADELALAMECRCYHGGEGRTRMKVMQLHARDFLFFFSLLLFIGVRFLPMLDCSVIGLEDMNFTF
mgnify:CR=1 FL=1